MNTANVARLAGAFTLLSQGATTLVLGTAPTQLLPRAAVVAVFFVAGTAPLAHAEASKPSAAAAVTIALVWTAYVGSVFGTTDIFYEVPLLGIAGAGLLVYSSRSEVE